MLVYLYRPFCCHVLAIYNKRLRLIGLAKIRVSFQTFYQRRLHLSETGTVVIVRCRERVLTVHVTEPAIRTIPGVAAEVEELMSNFT